MATSSIARRVAQKEIRLFFASPVAWLFLASFAAVTLFVFFWVESFFARNIADIRPLFEWMPILLIFLCAALTMRMWSEERRSGTLEHVLTQPVSLWRFVLGKFQACFTLLLLALACTLPLPVTVALIADLDWGPVIAGYVATALLGASYLSAGLLVSARTDNPIVSLIGSVALCGALYLPGSVTLTDFFDNRSGEFLRLLGTGARFESITRGVIDARDLFYYASLILTFLTLNVYALEKERWDRSVATARHRRWRSATILLLCNLLLANIWLHRIDELRLDMTQGRLFSISTPTHDLLEQLQEPLLIRGYLSTKTHPLLAPLVPQLRDLIREYELAGQGKVRVEFVDPAAHPELEQEANERYGIAATPFQVADRYQASLVNSYFNILVRYGSEHDTLGFNDLIEVRTAANTKPEVMLRNPEYDISHAIKNVLFNYRMGGNLFDGIDEPLEFIGYVSNDALLPDQLLVYKESIKAQLQKAAQHSKGKFSVRFIEPESRGGRVARQITEEWGFKPMVASLGDDREFFFYMTLADARQVVQLPTDDFDPTGFRVILDSGLKRFASGFTSTVALALPQLNQEMARFNLGGPTFTNLERTVSRSYNILLEDLSDGGVSPEADILAVVAPQQLDEKSVFAIDQFLMRGGSVILATSPFTAEISGGQLRLQDWDSGLQQWLAHHGIEIADTLVLDKQHATFPAPIMRQAGGYEFQDFQMIDYPYFIDLRPPGLEREHPITANLPQLTMAWASPVTVARDENRRVTSLLTSSAESWQSASMDIMPSVDASGLSNFRMPQPDANGAGASAPAGTADLGFVVEGRFDSWFTNREHPLQSAGGDGDNRDYNGPAITSLLQRSPESARIVLYASNDFMDDQILNGEVAATGTQYLGPLELFMNTLDWALQDDQLLQIRSRAHFNRTLPPMERQAQTIIEYLNYGLALLWLALLAIAHWIRKILRRRRYARVLAL
ncbi:Gldg family protein [bacterium]|nr:Gldg family protein [bacterium]